MNTSKDTSSINVDLGVRAEAKIDVRAEVPKRSMGRLIDALTDMLSPFSERRGLRGDLIRLQREDVAFEIAKKARERIALEKAKIRPVPNKILIPLIEAASNEDVDDEYMQGLWANLLASAATKADVEPRFVGILRELHGQQAEVFEQLALNNAEEFSRPIAQMVDAPPHLEPALLRQGLTRFFRQSPKAPTVPEIYAHIMDWIDRPGCAVIDILIHTEDDMWSLDEHDRLFSGSDHEFHLEVLASLGLCRNVNDFYRSKTYEIQYIYYKITELGVRFFLACKNLSAEKLRTTAAIQWVN